jgi:hypothetical protein
VDLTAPRTSADYIVETVTVGKRKRCRLIDARTQRVVLKDASRMTSGGPNSCTRHAIIDE